MVRVLHVVENFNGQATEKWLSQSFLELKRSCADIEWSFFCTLEKPGKFSAEIIEYGGKVFCSPRPVTELIPFMRHLRKTIRDGSFDIIHCHQDLMSALFLFASVGLPVKKRIVHIHNTSLSLPTQSYFKSIVFRWLFRYVCLYLADHIVGVSEEALNAFYQGSKKSQMTVIHCGIDLLPFRDCKDNAFDFRKVLNIPHDAIIMLFVGRMIEYKNPCYVLDVLEQLLPSQNNVYAVFAGAGPLEDNVRIIADEKDISNRVRVLGWRDDVPSIMKSCDLLIWPGVEEPMEGLGLGVVEAQAAGLSVVMSRNVPKEAIVIPGLVDIVQLAAGSKVWADTIIAALGRNRLDRQKALDKVGESSFSISKSASNIILLHNSK